MNKEIDAINNFRNGFNCAQSVLISYLDEVNIDKDSLLRISCAFGAGMGRMQDLCGAVSGSYMVIGLKLGKCHEQDNEAQEKTYQLVREFESEFQKINKTTCCRELLGCNLLTEEGKKYYIAYNLKEEVCIKCIESALQILKKLLN